MEIIFNLFLTNAFLLDSIIDPDQFAKTFDGRIALQMYPVIRLNFNFTLKYLFVNVFVQLWARPFTFGLL